MQMMAGKMREKLKEKTNETLRTVDWNRGRTVKEGRGGGVYTMC